MMKKTTITLLGIVCTSVMALTGCRRHYEVQRVRVPIDTLTQRDSSLTQDEEELFGNDEEPLMEVPETNFELKANDPNRRKNKKELEEYMKENGMY